MQPRPAVRILAFTGKHTGKFLWYGMFGMPVLDKYRVSVKIFFSSMGSTGLGHERVERCQELGMRWEEDIWGVLSEEERYLRAKDRRMDTREQTSDHGYQLVLVGSPVKRTWSHDTETLPQPYLCALHIQLSGFCCTFSLFLELNFLSTKYTERPDKRKMTSETSPGLSFPPRHVLTRCCPFD